MAELAHIMVDLETLGVVPGCVGFSIGAVRFYPERQELGDEFYKVVNVESCLVNYLREEQATKDWWDKQSNEAKVALNQARAGEGVHLFDAMESLNRYLLSCGGLRSVRLYGNGADFDNPILRCMYDAAGVNFMRSKAGFFGGRCYRTMKSLDELLGPEFRFEKIERHGTYHNALDDAKSQAIHLMDNIARIRASLKGE